jgi:hypothetical protein
MIPVSPEKKAGILDVASGIFGSFGKYVALIVGVILVFETILPLLVGWISDYLYERKEKKEMEKAIKILTAMGWKIEKIPDKIVEAEKELKDQRKWLDSMIKLLRERHYIVEKIKK